MPGYSVKVPLVVGASDGPYNLNKTMKEVIKQNFKMLVLTSPGERMMVPEFGVGIRHILFEPNLPSYLGEIESRIVKQANKYMPYISFSSINIQNHLTNPEINVNAVKIVISYSVPSLGYNDSLLISEVTGE